MNNTTVKKSSHKVSFIDSITQYEGLFVFGILGCAILGIIILTGMFKQSPSNRNNVLFNAVGAIGMAIGFIYIIFKFMGNQIIILGNKIDIGMIIYIAIVLFVMFVLGN